MSAPAGETHRAGVCQTRHGVGPAPPITSATSAIHPPGAARLRRAGEVPGPTPGHPFQSPELDLCRLVHDPRRIADRDPSLLHRQPPRRSGGTVFRQHPGGVGHCSPAHLQQRGRFPSSKRIVQICAISLWRPSGDRRRRELVGFASMAALFSSRAPMEAAKPGSRSRSTKVFCGWQGRRAARRPSGRRPSRFPRPRVPRTEPTLTDLEPRWPRGLPATPPAVECNSAEGRLEILVYGSLKGNLTSGLPGGI